MKIKSFFSIVSPLITIVLLSSFSVDYIEKSEAPPPVLFSLNAVEYKARFHKDKISFAVLDSATQTAFVWDMTFKNSNENVRVRTVEGQIVRTAKSLKKTNPNYRQVWYHQLYERVDLSFFQNENGEIQYTFFVKPGGKISDISFDLTGIEELLIDSKGELVMETPMGFLRKTAPKVRQFEHGEDKEIDCKYVFNSDGTVGFEIGEFNPELPLIIE